MTDSEPVTGECNSVSTACKSLKLYKSHIPLKKEKEKTNRKAPLIGSQLPHVARWSFPVNISPNVYKNTLPFKTQKYIEIYFYMDIYIIYII